MPTPRDDNLLRMDGWPGGVNNRIRGTEDVTVRDADAIPNSAFLRRALNVDLTAEGHPLRRRGYTLADVGYAHSAFYSDALSLFFVVIEGVLKIGHKVSELTPLMTVNRYLRMSYTHHAGAVYFSNGQESGRYVSSGLEVWPGPPQQHEVHDDEDLELVDNVYETMPIGQIVTSFSGRIYCAKDEVLWFSEGMSTHMARLATNYYMLPNYIQMLQPVEGGIFVGDKNRIIFLKGSDPFAAEQVNVYPHGVVPYASARIPGEKLGVPGEEEIPVWWTKDGVLSAGMPDGSVRTLTRDRLAVPEYGFGAVSLREREGMSQVVSSLQNGGDANNMVATDTVTAEIRS